MHGALLEILASNLDPTAYSVRPGLGLEAIQRRNSSGVRLGRPRELDFGVVRRGDHTTEASEDLVLAIEAKWAGSSHATPTNILLDLTRLTLAVNAHPAAFGLFVLAGGKGDLRKLMARGVLGPHGGRRKTRLLRYPYDRKSPTAYNLASRTGRATWLDLPHRRKLAEEFGEVPTRILSNIYKQSHEDPPDWEVQVWRIFPS